MNGRLQSDQPFISSNLLGALCVRPFYRHIVRDFHPPALVKIRLLRSLLLISCTDLSLSILRQRRRETSAWCHQSHMTNVSPGRCNIARCNIGRCPWSSEQNARSAVLHCLRMALRSSVAMSVRSARSVQRRWTAFVLIARESWCAGREKSNALARRRASSRQNIFMKAAPAELRIGIYARPDYNWTASQLGPALPGFASAAGPAAGSHRGCDVCVCADAGGVGPARAVVVADCRTKHAHCQPTDGGGPYPAASKAGDRGLHHG